MASLKQFEYAEIIVETGVPEEEKTDSELKIFLLSLLSYDLEQQILKRLTPGYLPWIGLAHSMFDVSAKVVKKRKNGRTFNNMDKTAANDDVEEEEEEEEERGTILDLGDGNLINKDWNNTTVSEEVSSIY